MPLNNVLCEFSSPSDVEVLTEGWQEEGRLRDGDGDGDGEGWTWNWPLVERGRATNRIVPFGVLSPEMQKLLPR